MEHLKSKLTHFVSSLKSKEASIEENFSSSYEEDFLAFLGIPVDVKRLGYKVSLKSLCAALDVAHYLFEIPRSNAKPADAITELNLLLDAYGLKYVGRTFVPKLKSTEGFAICQGKGAILFPPTSVPRETLCKHNNIPSPSTYVDKFAKVRIQREGIRCRVIPLDLSKEELDNGLHILKSMLLVPKDTLRSERLVTDYDYGLRPEEDTATNTELGNF